jgi:hypothetical protein
MAVQGLGAGKGWRQEQRDDDCGGTKHWQELLGVGNEPRSVRVFPLAGNAGA